MTFPPNSLFQCPFTTRLSSSFPGDFLPFWPELANNFTLDPSANFLPSHRAGFLVSVPHSVFCFLGLLPCLAGAVLRFSENRSWSPTGRNSMSQFWFLGSLLPVWAACPRICLHHPGGGITSPAVSHAFLIYFLVLKKHFQSWLIRKGHTGGNYLRVMHIWKQDCFTLTLPSNPYPKWLGPEVLGQSFSDLHNICIDDTW